MRQLHFSGAGSQAGDSSRNAAGQATGGGRWVAGGRQQAHRQRVPHRLYRPDSRRSSEGAKKVRPPAAPRGTMEILVTGSYSGMRAPTCVGRRAEESWVRSQGASKHVSRAGSYSGMRAPTCVGRRSEEGGKQACQLGRCAQGRQPSTREHNTQNNCTTSLQPTGSQPAEQNAWAGHSTHHPAAPLPHQGVAGLVVRHQPLLLLAHHRTLLLGARNDALQRVGDLVLWGEEGRGGGRVVWCPRRRPDSCHSPLQPMPRRPPCSCATCCWPHTELPATGTTHTDTHSPTARERRHTCSHTAQPRCMPHLGDPLQVAPLAVAHTESPAPIQNPRKPTLEISFRLRRAARMAASFIRLARSAPGGKKGNSARVKRRWGHEWWWCTSWPLGA